MLHSISGKYELKVKEYPICVIIWKSNSKKELHLYSYRINKINIWCYKIGG
jgi:hypothetical protein